MGDDDFDSYLNEVSGEDVTSGSSDSFQPTPTTTTETPDGGEASLPSAKLPTGLPKQTTTKQAPQIKEPKATPSKLRPHVLGGFINDEGDIVDEKGAVIAQKGTVRRVYEENGRLRQRLQEVERNMQNIQHNQNDVAGLGRFATQYGLDNQDLARAMDMAGRVKRGDIISVAKELVAMAAAEGHNVSDIVGADVGDAVDMRAIKSMLETHLGPLQKARQDSAQETRVRQVAKQQYDKFLDDNPSASLHEFEIANIARQSKVTPQRAYNMLLDFSRRHGLDFDQPLEPQIRQKAEQAATGMQQQQPAQTKPMPNGAAVVSRNGGQPPAPIYADPEDDWGTIIRDAQKQLRQ